MTRDEQSRSVASMMRGWNARAFLAEDYAQAFVPDDQAGMFRFNAEALARIGRHFESGLDLGCGPSLHYAAQFVPWVSRWDMADYDSTNLDEIRRWIDRSADAHNWSTYLGAPNGVLHWELEPRQSVAEREALLRSRIGALLRCDIRDDQPLGRPIRYPLVGSFFALEWVIPTLDGWRANMRRTASLVLPGGWIFLLGAHGIDHRLLGGRRCDCARVTLEDVRAVLLDLGFAPETMRLEVIVGSAPERDGLAEFFMACAQLVR